MNVCLFFGGHRLKRQAPYSKCLQVEYPSLQQMSAGRVSRHIFARAFVPLVSTSTPGTMSSSSSHLQMVLHPYQFDPSYQFRSGFITFSCGACTLPT